MNNTNTREAALKELTQVEARVAELRKIIEAPEVKKTIIERVNSYEDACKELGIDPFNTLPHPDPQNDRQRQSNNYHKRMVVVDALNEGEVVDWRNKKQRKWEVRFYVDNSGGLVFASASGDYWRSASGASAAARLSLLSEAKAIHFAKNFMDLHKIDFNL